MHAITGFTSSLLLGLTLALPGSGLPFATPVQLPWPAERVPQPSDTWWVDVSQYPSLTAAVQANAGKTETLLVRLPTVITMNTVVPDGLDLIFVEQGHVELGTATLEIKGDLRASERRWVFGNSSGGRVLFSPSTVTAIHPGWWGPPGAAALLGALEAGALSGIEVLLPPGEYPLDDFVSLTMPPGSSLGIRGQEGTVLESALAEPAIAAGILGFHGDASNKLSLDGFTVRHSGSYDLKGKIDCLFITGLGSVKISGVTTTGATLRGIELKSVGGGTVTGVTSSGNNYAGIAMKSCRRIKVSGGTFEGNGFIDPSKTNGDYNNGYGITCGSANPPNEDIIIEGNTVVDTVRKGIDVHAGHGIIIRGNTVSGFNRGGIYAVGESSTKNVRDVVITGNRIVGYGEDTGPYGPAMGIQVGSSGSAPFAGSMVVSDNLIRKVYQGVVVDTPESASAVRRVIISGNNISEVLANDSSSNNEAAIVVGKSASLISDVVVTNNAVHAESLDATDNLIFIRRARSATVMGNTVRLDSGAINHAINTTGAQAATVLGNHVNGSGSIANAITSSAGHILRANIFNGTPLSDQN